MSKQKQTLVEKPYTTNDGLPTVVLIPDNEPDLSTGIPVSLDLSSLYNHMPEQFLVSLYEALHAQGLIKPKDYLAPDASQRFKAAMLTVIRHDFLNAVTLAYEEVKRNG